LNEVKFFGYLCSKDKWKLDEDKIKALSEVKLPNNLKEMRSFLGTGVFFQKFVPNYAALAAPLFDTTKKDFDWNLIDNQCYHNAFNNLKAAMIDSFTLFFPDYSLDWILRTDASDLAYGAILFQVKLIDDGQKELQPIAVLSSKFTQSALNWETIKKECYAIFYALKKWTFYLVGKSFVIETDHNNLRWLEQSDNAMIIRWRVFIQNFDCLIRHIPGKENTVADYLSRTSMLNNLLLRTDFVPYNDTELYEPYHFEEFGLNTTTMLSIASSLALDNTEEIVNQGEQVPFLPLDNIDQTLKAVHNGRIGHFGVAKTLDKLNELFPNHKIPYRVVQDFVLTCPICQKDRKELNKHLASIYRSIKQPHCASAIGVDNVSITPPDIHGNTGATVIINLFTKLIAVYPYKTISGLHTSVSVLKYICSYGLIEKIYTDPGSDFTSNIVKDLNKWLGSTHVFSLVDRHESNGVERVIREVTRHLRNLCLEEKIKDKWGDDAVLPVIQFIINSTYNRESGTAVQKFSPFALTFGTLKTDRFDEKKMTEKETANFTTKFVMELNENFKILHEASLRHQSMIRETRSNLANQPTNLAVGDIVFKIKSGPFKQKLSSIYLGPYEVVSIVKNDIELRHLAMGNITSTHIENLKLYIGTLEDAVNLAMADADQHWVNSISSYKGDSISKASLEFYVEFADGDKLWLPLSKDISTTVQFENFVHLNPELTYLLYDYKTGLKFISDIKKTPNKDLKVNYSGYTKLKFFGYLWAESLQLPNFDIKEYILFYKILKIISENKFQVNIPILDSTKNKYIFICDRYWFYSFGYIKSYLPDIHLIVNDSLIAEHPEIKLIPNSKNEGKKGSVGN
jgi:hypothetical protein